MEGCPVRGSLVSMSWLLAMGCSYPQPDCADGYDRTESGKCVSPATSSSDSGAVLDGDTAVPDSADTLTGPIEIYVLAETGGIEIEDSCVGTVLFDVADTPVSGAVSGTLSCTFSGTVAGFIGTDPFTGTIDGDVANDGTVSGPFFMDIGAFGVLDTSWTGILEQQKLTGELGDQMIFEVGALEVPVDYTGIFSATAD